MTLRPAAWAPWLALVPTCADAAGFSGPGLGPVPLEFVLFALVLAGVALAHDFALPIAAGGAVAIALYKVALSPFAAGPGWAGLGAHLAHEWVIAANLFLLLLGFALLAQHFGDSHVATKLPGWLPDDWKGGFVLLALVFALSSFLDNIAAAVIGGTVARTVFRGQVHVGYLVALVAAANAGGAGSVVGDTTTTMMWIAGVHPLSVLEGYVGAGVALCVFGIPAALQQHRLSPITRDAASDVRVDWTRAALVAFIMAAVIAANVAVSLHWPALAERAPVPGLAVWGALLLGALLRAPKWALLPGALKGAVFLLSLVLCASMTPVEKLPEASWRTAFGLGFVSAVFDNIPLTALALRQGGYDWGFLAYAVGFGGSMLWFGSSAGVALCSMYPQARAVGPWLRQGWHVVLAYVIGFAAMLALLGFHPDAPLAGKGL